MVFGSWDSGFLPLGVRGSTLLGNEVRMHCQLNTLWDRFTGFGSYLWASGKQTLLCIEMHARLGLKCASSFFRFRSTQCSSLWSSILGSWFGSSPHGKAVTWLTNHHQASRGPHNAQLFKYLCSWLMHLVQFWCGSSPHSKAVMWRTNCHKASGMNQCNPLT